jgi:hypothetical protein
MNPLFPFENTCCSLADGIIFWHSISICSRTPCTTRFRYLPARCTLQISLMSANSDTRKLDYNSNPFKFTPNATQICRVSTPFDWPGIVTSQAATADDKKSPASRNCNDARAGRRKDRHTHIRRCPQFQLIGWLNTFQATDEPHPPNARPHSAPPFRLPLVPLAHLDGCSPRGPRHFIHTIFQGSRRRQAGPAPRPHVPIAQHCLYLDSHFPRSQPASQPAQPSPPAGRAKPLAARRLDRVVS